jgi:hypothetical protein
VSERYKPTSDYFITSVDANGIFSTEDGWPSESYVEFSKGKRLLLQWGSVDPQLTGYNFAADEGIIFPESYIQTSQEGVSISNNIVTEGCFAVSSTNNLSIPHVNSSWATLGLNSATISADLTATLNLTSNLTNCGISSVLNATLQGSTADSNFVPYSNFSYSSMIWSWLPGEPKNYSSGIQDNLFNCVTSNLDLNGRFAVSDCSQDYYAACRAYDQPYNWTASSNKVAYSYANQVCPEGYYFAVPRTALENSYLTQAMRALRINKGSHPLIWVDFNSLDHKGITVYSD